MFCANKSIVIVKVSQETLQWWHMPPQCVFFLWMACILEAKWPWCDRLAGAAACVPSCCSILSQNNSALCSVNDTAEQGSNSLNP